MNNQGPGSFASRSFAGIGGGRLRSLFIFLLKALVSLVLLAFLFSRVDVVQFLRIIASARLSYLGLALLAYFVGQLISSFRWALLARPLGFRNPWKDFVVFYFIGMFFNLFAPSIVGGDVGRAFYLARGLAREKEAGWAGPAAHAAVSVIADRAVGMAVLVWMGAGALFLFPGYPVPWIIRLLMSGLGVGAFLLWVFLPLLNRFLERRENPLGQNLFVALESYQKNPGVLLQTISLSLIIHTIQAGMQILLGRALDVEIAWSYGFILYPLVGVFSALPVTINGIGLREGGYLFLLRLIEVSSEKAVAFGILWFLVVALDSLIGGMLFVLRKTPASSESSRH